MNILMVTNTYLPHVGGVARSIQSTIEQLRILGHKVLVIAPEFPNSPENESDVLRIPALQNFNGTDFSVKLPLPTFLIPQVANFNPEVIHSHHPFLLGDTALRLAAKLNAPVIFTHHTMYEQYAHYVPINSFLLKHFVINLTSGYANLCQGVIAPSESIRDILLARGVDAPISVIPSGIDYDLLSQIPNDLTDIKKALKIPPEAPIVGHVGRLAPEKNLYFLCKCVARYFSRNHNSHFLVVGDGPFKSKMESFLRSQGYGRRVHFVGTKTGLDLIRLYQVMDLFLFTSYTETQGLVLAEALAASVPVIALNAPGAREIVAHGKNGFLLPNQNVKRFSEAIENYFLLPVNERARLKEAARKVATSYSKEVCTTKLVELYQESKEKKFLAPKKDFTRWESMQRVLEIDADLSANFWKAVKAALEALVHSFIILSRRTSILGRWLRRFRPSKSSNQEDSAAGSNQSTPALVLVQIDGLSRLQFETALRNYRMPFVRKLVNSEGYSVVNLYSGLPSTTPAMQAELFYGVKTAVPAFGFYQRINKIHCLMNEIKIAREVEDSLSSVNPGLLEGGSSFSNIYSGGALESHFCPGNFSWRKLLHRPNIRSFLVLIPVAVRTLVIILIELPFILIDVICSFSWSRNWIKEIVYIPTRIIVGIVLREFITARVILDIKRGLPIIHVNYLGYDESAHRRGPNSPFAHRALRGIDRCIKRIWLTSLHTSSRSWQVWIYSDHGQERVRSYFELHGKTVEEAVRNRWPNHKIEVDAVGPLGHLYLEKWVPLEQRKEIARSLTAELNVPLSFCRSDNESELIAFYKDQELLLPRDGSLVIDKSLPYYAELLADLLRLAQHRDSGDILFSGTDPEGKPISFPLEHGAHGSFGPQETNAFALLPPQIELEESYHEQYLRPLILHRTAKEYLNPATDLPRPKLSTKYRIRVMSYNVHGCIGIDGNVSVDRICSVIQRYNPDIICLQELDIKRKRSGNLDQALQIASRLNMDFHFHPSIQEADEKYGDAILSRLPFKVAKADILPKGPKGTEPRGAILIELEFDQYHKIKLLNTHLGLGLKEQIDQVDAIVNDWLTSAQRHEYSIICGDFNFGPNSIPYRRITSNYNDCSLFNLHKNSKTWPTKYPLRQIDYVFVSSFININRYFIPQNRLTIEASDHFPIIVDLDLPLVNLTQL